jgi:RNA polymerase sigma-54 factor
MQTSFVQKQQMGVKMSPQIYQSLKLMELPLVDLREVIEEELEKNPALEVLEDKSTVSLDDAEPQQKEVEEYFETSSDSGFSHNGQAGAAASDEHLKFMEGVLTRPETLQQHLLWQLQLEPIDNELRIIANILIQNLDDDGFHKEPPDTLFNKNPELLNVTDSAVEFSPIRLNEAIRIVQQLDPVGCCTANYHEALKVQILSLNDVPSCMEDALEYLELFERGKFSIAAKKMNCSEDDAHLCFDLLKKLSPFPGRRFTATEVRFVVPDIQVIKDVTRSGGQVGDDLVIIYNDEVIPVLGISPFFEEFEPEKRTSNSIALASADKSAKKFAKENVREARYFISSISMREHTLKLVAKAIVKFQRPFFKDGPQYLLPLTLGDIAGELGMHEATVSRAAHGKYMQTEWGIFELRYFFTNSISGTGSTGSHFSKGGVKAIIQELIGADERHLSDLEISEVLAQRGISLARRTVAKYRKELDLGSSYTR